jgi:hypothetical protein
VRSGFRLSRRYGGDTAYGILARTLHFGSMTLNRQVPPPNMRVQRTRAARFARIGSPLTRYPLGRGQAAESLKNTCSLETR